MAFVSCAQAPPLLQTFQRGRPSRETKVKLNRSHFTASAPGPGVFPVWTPRTAPCLRSHQRKPGPWKPTVAAGRVPPRGGSCCPDMLPGRHGLETGNCGPPRTRCLGPPPVRSGFSPWCVCAVSARARARVFSCPAELRFSYFVSC